MSAAAQAREFARLASHAGDTEAPKSPQRSGLELALANRRPAPPGAESPEEAFARIAEARLRCENAE